MSGIIGYCTTDCYTWLLFMCAVNFIETIYTKATFDSAINAVSVNTEYKTITAKNRCTNFIVTSVIYPSKIITEFISLIIIITVSQYSAVVETSKRHTVLVTATKNVHIPPPAW